MGRFSAADHPRDPAGRFARKATPADRGNLADLAAQTEPAADLAVPSRITGSDLVAVCVVASMLDWDSCRWAEDDDPDWPEALAGLVGLYPSKVRQAQDAIAAGQAADIDWESLHDLVWDAACDLTEEDALSVVNSGNLRARIWVADLRLDSTAVLTHLAADPDPEVRGRVAENPSTPAGTLTALAADTDKWVREGVASNPRTPTEALRSLAVDKDPDVREEARANPACPDLTAAERTHGGLLAD